MNTLPRILVIGGSGFVGRHLCQHLAPHQVQITVSTRQMFREAPPAWPGVNWVHTPRLEGEALEHLIRGHDVVIHLAAILHGSAAEFDALHVQLPQRLAACCAASGVRHLIHVSAIGADPDGPSMYQRSKGRGEAVLKDIANQTGLPLTILQPSVIFGEDDQFMNTFARLLRYAPFVPLAGAQTRFQPVWVEDVAQALTLLALAPAQGVSVYEACGPEVFTLAELVRHAGRWSGCERPVLALPHELGKLQALLMECLPGKTLMSRDNVDSMRVDNVATGRWPGLQALGIQAAALDQVFKLSAATTRSPS